MTNQEIFKTTGIRIYKDHETKSTLMNRVDHKTVGYAIKDEQAWRFQPIPGTRYGYSTLKNVGEVIFQMNKRDNIVS